jgi:polysaccharide deacetylase family protein (PEP-CTERM system associated)
LDRGILLNPQPKCVFSVDVEDWFHIMDLPDAPQLPQWDRLPSHVAKNFYAILELLNERDVKATFFFLGWVAERHPDLVRAALNSKHEIASHGYAHDLIYEISRQQFSDDVSHAKRLLEDIGGRPVLGYRAPGFSVTDKTPWFFEVLAEAGYAYSSSIFPAERQHGGMLGFQREPKKVETNAGDIIEFPITVTDVINRPVCFFGGGYLRLFPYFVIKHMSKRVLEQGSPVIYYLHPREIDPHHPRMPMTFKRGIKSYIGLSTVQTKVRRLLRDFSFTTFNEIYKDYARAAA